MRHEKRDNINFYNGDNMELEPDSSEVAQDLPF